MPPALKDALPKYKKDLAALYGNNQNDTADFCKSFAQYLKDWFVKGVPMTLHKGVPPKGLKGGQPVAGNSTAAPGQVLGEGLGGIDTSSPGEGMGEKAKKEFVKDLAKTLGTNSGTPEKGAGEIADAIYKFVKNAKVMTIVQGTIPPGVAVPAPAGPVSPGKYTGKATGGIDKDKPGMGLDAALPIFVKDLMKIYGVNQGTPDSASEKLAEAIDKFVHSAKVDTVDQGQAGGGPASVSTESGSGSTSSPGSPIMNGKSTSGKIS